MLRLLCTTAGQSYWTNRLYIIRSWFFACPDERSGTRGSSKKKL